MSFTRIESGLEKARRINREIDEANRLVIAAIRLPDGSDERQVAFEKWHSFNLARRAA